MLTIRRFKTVLSIVSLSLILTGCGQTTSTKSQASTSNQSSTHTKHKAKNKNSLVSKALLSYLKMTKKDFSSERKSGKSLVDIARQKNITEQQLEDFLVNQRLQLLQSKNKHLTASLLAKKKAQITNTIKKQIEKIPQQKIQA